MSIPDITQGTITTSQLCEKLGISRATLANWTASNPRLRAAKWNRGTYLIHKLEEIGLLREKNKNAVTA
jgi:excisionase family DNA binding protein